MAKGFDKNKERLAEISSFAKDLVRRSSSTCELCGASEIPLSVFEVPPVPVEPDFEKVILVCETCKTQIENPKKLVADHWRCLNNTVWSEVPAIQVISVLLLHKLTHEDWVTDLLEQLYLEEEIQEWIHKAEMS